MSLPGPPPGTPRLRGPLLYRFRFRPAVSRFHTIKTSADGTGIDYTLRELVRIWTGAAVLLPPLQAATGRRNRWKTVKLLRVLLLARLSPGTVLPAAFASIANDPRVSQVGTRIGSKWCAKRKKHLDIDWFGPSKVAANATVQAGKPTYNWWQPSLDGAAAEIAFAMELLHYLEASLGLAPSGGASDAWSWPQGVDPADPVAALDDAAIDAAVEAQAETHGFDQVSVEWWIGNNGAPNPVQQFTFSTQPAAGGSAFRIESPDCFAPDPNLA